MASTLYSAVNPPPHAIHSASNVFFVFTVPFLILMSGFVILVISLSGRFLHRKYLIPLRIVLSKESIQITSSDEASVIPWKTYKYFKETRRSFIIWDPKGSHWFLLPKRAFTSAADLEKCREFLAQNLKPSRQFFG
jgi:hypothetical protein